MKLSELDKNFATEQFNCPDAVFYDVRKEPAFRIYGLSNPTEEEIFRRLPAEVAEATSPEVAELSKHTAGGRIRFKTDSPYIILRADMPPYAQSPRSSLCAMAGFDMYITKNGFHTHLDSYGPPEEQTEIVDGFSRIGWYPDDGVVRDFTLYFPPYAGVNNVYIGLKEGAKLLPGDGYKREKPVVFYGSSITQGGIVSRPSNTYQGFLSRRFDFDYINLGFSGSAKGEEVMARYIAGLDMSVFVMDYDHNAPTAAHLEKTHEPFFRIIRKAHPDLPVIFMSAPNIRRNPDWTSRRKVIFGTYARALDAGDKNVYFVDGEQLYDGDAFEACTVDGLHPNDLGFYRMAKRVGATLELIYTRENKKE
ncbi:MAG: hypothetical protein E7408_07430 [Ruminococcaceae bacterium]|nr:hypothetical protein [Oscillospiraceae bacterium]